MTRDMRPYRQNDTAVLPDDVADSLVANGDAQNPAAWPEAASLTPPPAKRLKTKGAGNGE